MMAKYPFLSDQWVAEARQIYAQAEAAGALSRDPSPVLVRVNLVVTDVPFPAGVIDAHVDTSSGRVTIDTGHLSEPDVTVSLDYPTARALFVAGDAQSVLSAFLSGRIKVDGDLTKLLDPRTGIWPGGGGLPGAAPLRPAAAGSPGGESARAPGQAPLGSAGPQLLDVAARLAEITE
ncbi:MAG TPA: hypothetical protein VL984_16300 [Acidimicrobiales bacterium]|nr:hypothetical protein [Acidimicrobiales bacterium]